MISYFKQLSNGYTDIKRCFLLEAVKNNDNFW